MRRGTSSLLALSLFITALPATSSAVPILVELKIRDPLAAVNSTESVGDDQVVLPGNGNGKGTSSEKGKSNEKQNSNEKGNGSGKENPGKGGKPDDTLTKADLKSLTLWLSANGKDWKALDGEIVDLGSDKITARVDTKGNSSMNEAMSTFGLPTGDITGESSQSYYLGVSTGSKTFSGGTYSTRLVSWQYFAKNQQAARVVSIPEPAVWPLFTMGALGAGLVLGGRKKR